jgi:tRNA pseudouridine55 synthase
VAVDGIVLIDKPIDITSRKAVDMVMAILKAKRAGHFGSLDPFATGLLCIGVGQGTKLLPFMQEYPKEYIALIGFEMSTDSDDITGGVTKRFDNVALDVSKLKTWFDENRGWINQLPPDYCAQKLNGKPLYKLKRANKEVSPRPKRVCLDDAEILDTGTHWARVRIVCSRGTYIRSIARDLGAHLGSGGYLRELKRIRSEGFSIEQATTIDDLAQIGEQAVIPLVEALHIPKARVTKIGEQGVKDGQSIQLSWIIDDVAAHEGAYVAVMNVQGGLLCVARVKREGGIWGHIARGFTLY